MDLILKFGITLISFGASILTAQLISSHESFSYLSLREKRYGSIDGLRGFLSISVIFHHFIITWYWKINGNWAPPPENYYHNYGRVSVALFFMITGFLFISKILREDGKTNWLKFYESRLFRIIPLYIFTIIIISLIVFSASHFELRVGFLKLAKQYINWFRFSGDIINDFSDTNLIVAAVVWTLRYEWTFYIFLPVLATIITRFKKVGSLFLLTLSILLFLKPTSIPLMNIDSNHLILFAVGGISAYINQCHKISASIMRSKLISSLTLLTMAFIIFYPRSLDLIHIILISIFFISIVLGNDIFGIFSLKPSILLGEISYSIYLIHGVILYLTFSTFNFVTIETLSIQEYTIFMPLICIFIVFISASTFILIEKPGINLGQRYVFSQKLLSIRDNVNKILQRFQ